MGSLQIPCFFDRVTFWALPFTNLLLYSQKCQGVPFLNLPKLYVFAAAPLVLTPFVRNQGGRGDGDGGAAGVRAPGAARRRGLRGEHKTKATRKHLKQTNNKQTNYITKQSNHNQKVSAEHILGSDFEDVEEDSESISYDSEL